MSQLDEQERNHEKGTSAPCSLVILHDTLVVALRLH